MTITPCQPADLADWATMRAALWPELDEARHRDEIATVLAQDDQETLSLIARTADGAAIGFAEAALRHDYVNGCETSPVAFLEGLYVAAEYRRKGHARTLVAAVADWARARGCSEFASDALLDNRDSHATHQALGFEETERVVYFRKPL